MRTLFVIVGLLGLFLAGLGWLEYRAACDGISRVNNMVNVLQHKEFNSKQENAADIMLPAEYGSLAKLMQADSLAVICFGAVFFVIGTTGFFVSRETRKLVTEDSLISNERNR